MPTFPVHTVTLTCHPETPAAAVDRFHARVTRMPCGALAVTYVIEGEIGRLRIPAPRTPAFAARLWEHTCCEVFVASKGLSAYHEFNLSPSGEWTAHAFSRYRDGGALGGCDEKALDPQITVRRAAGSLELDALIRLARLSPAYLNGPLSLALSAVIEGEDGVLSYWALRHPAGRPDFHHADAFALELAKDSSSLRAMPCEPTR